MNLVTLNNKAGCRQVWCIISYITFPHGVKTAPLVGTKLMWPPFCVLYSALVVSFITVRPSNLISCTGLLQLSPWPSGSCGATRTRKVEILSSITLKSVEMLLPRSSSLAFCQFSRLCNDLNDRSESSGWDLGVTQEAGNAVLRNLMFARQYAIDPLL